MKDLVLLVADKNAQFALQGALERPQALSIRPISFEFRVHPGHDGGARRTGPDVLALEWHRFSHGLLVLDFEGSGTDLPTGLAVEGQLDSRLRSRWGDRAKSIVIEPELDVWMWGADNSLEAVIGKPAGKHVRQWLGEHGFPLNAAMKPTRPKEAMEAVLREVQKPRSSALYRRIATQISLARCTDPAFHRLREQLTSWFGSSSRTVDDPASSPIPAT